MTKTCPCNEYPLEPHFYVAKLCFAGVHLCLLLNAEAVLTSTQNVCFERKGVKKKKKKKKKKNTAFKNLSILHGRVFVHLL